ncbi:neprilysin-2 isoform X3 [Parasteatoda tepidariorum]|uniref:neprilysin-2 isoform X3 n=1 Tax=Parasteatoda tepidariorum TaxID=114398 RepID=UPI001C726B64|nr:neprilysin-2-like isoform X2 [Parasteatoda tepidariorum]
MSTSVGHSQLTLTSEPEKFRNPPWWNRRTKLERTLCFLTVTSLLMLAVMAAALAVFGYLYQRNIDSRETIFVPSNAERFVRNENSSDMSDICLTPGCVKTAAEILQNLNEDADPCDNFYKFACGGWLDKHAIADDRSSVSVFSDVQDELNLKLRVLLDKQSDGSEPKTVKMIKDMYDSCMNLKSIEKSDSEPLQKVLKTLGGWPVVVGENWDGSNFDWMETLFAFRKLGYSHDILVDLSVTADYRNNTVHIIDLDQTSLGMPDRTYLVKGLNDSSTEAYFNLMIKTAKKLGANEQTVEKELLQALNFEITLANYSLPREERRNLSSMYNKFTLPQLQELVPGIDWPKYFNGLLNDPITENETMIVSVPKFLKKFGELIATTDKRIVANYMLWRVVAQSLTMLSKDWRALAQEYSSVITGKSQEEPRWEQCLSSLSGSLGIALSSYYVKHYFKGDSKHRAMELVKYISKEFLIILEQIDWMDDETKKQAKEKAKAITPYIGYPQELLNESLVMELYENLTITNGSYFENIMSLRRWSTDYAFSQLRKPNIKGEWKKHARAAVVNAFYNALENSIEFPAGILQNAFFNKDRPHYMNFGGIGYVIGHEITHGFDDRGRQFDKDGNNKNWWDHTTDERFKEKAKCIIHQYGNYTADNGQNLNGINTQGENIADNGGLKEAYLAYNSWVRDNGAEKKLPGLKYTPSQLFWISAANVWCGKYRPEVLKLRIISGSHSPPEFRVIGPMSNLKEFSKEFDCPAGSNMNPHKKCQVW